MAKSLPPSGYLKQRRLELGLTQAELASRAGIEQSQISKLERNLDVRLSTLMKVLTALDLDLELVPRARPGSNVGEMPATLPVPTIDMHGTASQPPHFDVPFQRPTGDSYPIPGTSQRFRPKIGTLLDRFAIPDDDESADVRARKKPRPRRK
jgi:transcriptional regulator with XRE-family HTH domain